MKETLTRVILRNTKHEKRLKLFKQFPKLQERCKVSLFIVRFTNSEVPYKTCLILKKPQGMDLMFLQRTNCSQSTFFVMINRFPYHRNIMSLTQKDYKLRLQVQQLLFILFDWLTSFSALWAICSSSFNVSNRRESPVSGRRRTDSPPTIPNIANTVMGKLL